MSGAASGLPALAAPSAGASSPSRETRSAREGTAKDFQGLLDVADAPPGQPGHGDAVKDQAAPKERAAFADAGKAREASDTAAKKRAPRHAGAKDRAAHGDVVKAHAPSEAAAKAPAAHDVAAKDRASHDGAVAKDHAAHLAASTAAAAHAPSPSPVAGATTPRTLRGDGRLEDAASPRRSAPRAERHADAPKASGTEPGFAAAERAAATASAAPATSPGPSSLAPPTPAAPAARAEPPRPLDASQTLLQLAMTDASLTVDVHRQVVNVALHTEATGALELELRLHEGRAHVLVAGPSAPLVAQHAPALREVLSQQGLSLGDFSMSQERRPPTESPERDAPTVPPTAAPASVTGPSRSKRHEGRIDVEA